MRKVLKKLELKAKLVEATAWAEPRERRAKRAAAAIRRYGGYRWVGIYEVGAEEIGVVGWEGPVPPTNPRFPRTQGLCGAAVAAGEPVIVGDVTADPRYLTTLDTTRSEIVIPVFDTDAVVGLIDVESERPHAFGDQDRELLERSAATIAPLFAQMDKAASVAEEGGAPIPSEEDKRRVRRLFWMSFWTTHAVMVGILVTTGLRAAELITDRVMWIILGALGFLALVSIVLGVRMLRLPKRIHWKPGYFLDPPRPDA